MKTKDLILMAFYLAIFVVLDYMANVLPLFKMPNGGTLGLGVIALSVASYHLGWKKGVAVGLLSVLLQFLTGRMYVVDPMQFVLEYLVAFGIYGLTSIFPNYSIKGIPIYVGIIVTNLIRYLAHSIAGTLYWKTEWWASVSYNGWYMIPTMIVCLILTPIIMNRIQYKK